MLCRFALVEKMQVGFESLKLCSLLLSCYLFLYLKYFSHFSFFSIFKTHSSNSNTNALNFKRLFSKRPNWVFSWKINSSKKRYYQRLSVLLKCVGLTVWCKWIVFIKLTDTEIAKHEKTGTLCYSTNGELELFSKKICYNKHVLIASWFTIEKLLGIFPLLLQEHL